jgi:hypothetical protein
MTPALKLGLQKGVNTCKRRFWRNQSLTKRKHIGIIMLAAQAGSNRVRYQRGARPGKPVYRN